MKIALDAFGSDNAPLPEVEGAVLAIKEDACSKIYLVGRKDELERELGRFSYPKERIEVVHASEVILMNDKAASTVRTKKDSSLVRAIKLHKDGMADAVVSAGNTGAVMAANLFTLGRIKNVLRPAIALSLPTLGKPAIMLDMGANVDCLPEHLIQFAKLGSLYSHFFYGVENPEVSLLNIGEESMKGNELSKATHKFLAERTDINFVGNVEPKSIFDGAADVIVCDGFVGNVILKTIEGTARFVFKALKEQMRRDWIAKVGAMLSYPAYGYLRRKLDHNEYGGALLVGLRGNPIVSHGSSNDVAIKNAVKFAARIAESGFLEHARAYYEEEKAS
ncbi:MAG: phosphate acyltransferase PlsX [Candidatus Cloacimonetes bacterium]|nr:phosphate acyltransferase PlsX [Candidatus Cloacimonadota bacterium]